MEEERREVHRRAKLTRQRILHDHRRNLRSFAKAAETLGGTATLGTAALGLIATVGKPERAEVAELDDVSEAARILLGEAAQAKVLRELAKRRVRKYSPKPSASERLAQLQAAITRCNGLEAAEDELLDPAFAYQRRAVPLQALLSHQRWALALQEPPRTFGEPLRSEQCMEFVWILARSFRNLEGRGATKELSRSLIDMDQAPEGAGWHPKIAAARAQLLLASGQEQRAIESVESVVNAGQDDDPRVHALALAFKRGRRCQPAELVNAATNWLLADPSSEPPIRLLLTLWCKGRVRTGCIIEPLACHLDVTWDSAIGWLALYWTLTRAFGRGDTTKHVLPADERNAVAAALQPRVRWWRRCQLAPLGQEEARRLVRAGKERREMAVSRAVCALFLLGTGAQAPREMLSAVAEIEPSGRSAMLLWAMKTSNVNVTALKETFGHYERADQSGRARAAPSSSSAKRRKRNHVLDLAQFLPGHLVASVNEADRRAAIEQQNCVEIDDGALAGILRFGGLRGVDDSACPEQCALAARLLDCVHAACRSRPLWRAATFKSLSVSLQGMLTTDLSPFKSFLRDATTMAISSSVPLSSLPSERPGCTSNLRWNRFPELRERHWKQRSDTDALNLPRSLWQVFPQYRRQLRLRSSDEAGGRARGISGNHRKRKRS